MKSAPIKELITEKISGEWGSDPSDSSGVAIIRTANFLNSGKIYFSNIVRRDIDVNKVAKKRLLSGDIIIEKSGGSPTQPVGRVVLFNNPDGDTYLCNNFTSVLRPNREVIFPEYLFYALHKNHQSGKTLRYQNKTTGIINLKLDNYLNSEIPLPPLDDQIRIAHLLGKVEGLIAQRKENLQRLDELLKSVFLEMFGFRDGTYTKWPVDRLSTHTEVVSGVTKGKKYKSEELIEVPYMRVANVQDGHFVLDEVKTIAATQKEIDQYQLIRGDLLLTEGGDPDKLGRGSVWEEQVENCIHQNHIFRVRIKERAEINSYYLSALVGSSYGKAYFLKSAKQTTGIASINSTQLKNFPTVIPSIDLQNRYASIVEKVESLKSSYQQSLAELENLYGALSQKVFKGELDLSRVILATEHPETHRKPKPLTQGFARQLIAAEILQRYNKNDMTQMKLQKLIHLTEYHAQLAEIQGDYQRQAAGPYDNKLMYGLAAGLEKQQWFKIHGRSQKATYSPLGKAGNHQKYLSHWNDKILKIDEVLNLLGKAAPEQCEIVSTLYAAWNDLLIDGTQITDKCIITEASHPDRWHEAKAAIDPTRWPKALDWMREHNLVPTGYGKQTRKLRR